MTEDNIKPVTKETIVKDNISRADMANPILYQELRENIKMVIKSLTEQQNTIMAISSIRRQVENKKIQISLCQLLEIVKPEIQQDIINSIANPDISQRNRTLKEKKTIFNDTASESAINLDHRYEIVLLAYKKLLFFYN
ncbi:17094_t:CDS:2 [Dentiscutata erythropus]|uniref:17094_t:CDS:1 n=1 Tax=Dentiscutata erythropus TaxID=1348616 RepID=A0A9N9K0Y5_9GLOM|nr:17094_t:CDS:2 [Dentiscutata erythropus]